MGKMLFDDGAEPERSPGHCERRSQSLARVGVCNPDPNLMYTGQRPAVAQNVTDGIKNPIGRKKPPASFQAAYT